MTRFHELMDDLKALHDKKGADYNGTGKDYDNLRSAQKWGVEPWRYALIRLEEKVHRLQSYAQGSTLKNESVYDSLDDIAVLSVIARVLLEEIKPSTAKASGPSRVSLKTPGQG